MSTSPLDATSVAELLRRQVAARYPLATYASVAKHLKMPVSSFASWLAAEDTAGFRAVGLATAHKILTELGATAKVHAKMEALWIEAHRAKPPAGGRDV